MPEPHGRLIDAEMLMKYCNNTKAKNISNNDIARFPTVIESSGYEWSDLITRQVDEILSIRPSIEADGTWLTEYTEEEAEKEFPSINRYNISTNTISREDAIELCAKAQGRTSTKSELKGISKIWQGLLKLPSAEAKLTQAEKCEDCISNSTNKDKIICSDCISSKAEGRSYMIKNDNKKRKTF